MKAKNLIVVLFLINLLSFSQGNDPNKGWYYGPNISYQLANGSYSKSYGFFDYTINYKYYNLYSAGVDGMYAFGRKHTISFGIHYQEVRGSYNYDWEINSLYNPNGVSNTYGRYIGQGILLPVKMEFCFFKGKISPFIMTGVTPQYFLTSRSFERTTYFNGKVEESTERYHDNRINLSWEVGFGVDINLDKSRFRIFVYDSDYEAPIFWNTLNGWSLWEYSIHIGISYYIKTSRR